MSLFLHINTALEQAYVAIAADREIIAQRESKDQKEHSSFLHPAINNMLHDAGCRVDELAAVSIVNGPGSYTGLRVGLSAAKGICFAAGIPLISLSTLEWLAWSFREASCDLIIPMIDARRMEVFTAAYDRNLAQVAPPSAMILDENSFSELQGNGKIIFTGNGAFKLSPANSVLKRATIETSVSGPREQADMAYLLYQRKQFSDLFYTEPFYLKAFHSPPAK